MKTLLSLMTFALMLTLGITMISCGGNKIEKATDTNGKEYTSAYICPMYCKGSGSAQPGKCPACKMDYIANAKVQQNKGHNHNHDHNHDGHDHSGHDHGDHSGHDHSGHAHDHDGDGKPDH